MRKTEYTKIAKGVYRTSTGTGKISKTNLYRVRKTIDGILTSKYFTNKTEAIKFYKSL